MISQKLLGEGFAVIPTDGKIYSPINGTVESVFKTKHAIGFKTYNGLEVLLHLGLDTVELDGKPFDIFVKEKEQVTSGQRIGTMNIDQIKTAGKDPVVLTIVTSKEKLADNIIIPKEEDVQNGDIVVPVRLK